MRSPHSHEYSFEELALHPCRNCHDRDCSRTDSPRERRGGESEHSHQHLRWTRADRDAGRETNATVSVWQYSQSTGVLTQDGRYVATCYSGHGRGLNNPRFEDALAIGPIPQGRYEIGEGFTHPHCGPVAMRLSPFPGTNTYGRSGFLIHGDNGRENWSASNGCIIASREVRLRIEASPDRTLEVIP